MIAVEIADPAWRRGFPGAAARARAAARAALSGELGRERGDLAILLADDETLGDLNVRFRGKTGPTNVLAFPAPSGAHGQLGDIALAFGVCAREAEDQGKSLADHLSHLVIHGVLHLIGYHHEERDEAERMEGRERELLERMGITDPYASR